jgi:hypothetical protein
MMHPWQGCEMCIRRAWGPYTVYPLDFLYNILQYIYPTHNTRFTANYRTMIRTAMNPFSNSTPLIIRVRKPVHRLLPQEPTIGAHPQHQRYPQCFVTDPLLERNAHSQYIVSGPRPAVIMNCPGAVLIYSSTHSMDIDTVLDNDGVSGTFHSCERSPELRLLPSLSCAAHRHLAKLSPTFCLHVDCRFSAKTKARTRTVCKIFSLAKHFLPRIACTNVRIDFDGSEDTVERMEHTNLAVDGWGPLRCVG